MRIFLEDQGNQGIDAEIAKKGHFWMETNQSALENGTFSFERRCGFFGEPALAKWKVSVSNV
jgi:hypothetical protein